MSTLLAFRNSQHVQAPGLLVGVVLDEASPWVNDLLNCLRQLPGLDVIVFTLTCEARRPSKSPGWLTEWLYRASRIKFDPFGEVKGEGLVSETRLGEIGSSGCGVILWLARGKALDRRVARHGAFTVRFGRRDRIIPFWDEVADNDVTSLVSVYWHENSLVRGRRVREMEVSTSLGLYFTMNSQEPLAAAIRTLAQLCLDVRDQGRGFEERLLALPEESIDAPADYPSSFASGCFAVEKLARSAYLRSTKRGKLPKWFVALRPNKGASWTDLTAFTEVPLPPGTSEMADPFLWEVDGRTYLLFEEMLAGTPRGRLAAMEVLDQGTYSEKKVILEKDYHLSYPCVFMANGELFMLPETAEAQRVDLYRFTRFPWEVELVTTLVEGMALVGTTPIEWRGHWYFFTTTSQPFMETLLFWSDRVDGRWNLHPASPVSVSVRNCRGAGHLFCRDGRLYRVTQDCSVCYGYAMQVNEVTRLTPTEFAESPGGYIPPQWSPGLIGTHTWNESAKYQVIDGIRYQ